VTDPALQAHDVLNVPVCVKRLMRLQPGRRLWHVRPMPDETTTDDAKRTVRVPLLLTTEEAKNLDDWQFANRLRTRSDAIRRLIELGLAAKRPEPEGGSPI
jgi:hypothetical protein